MKIETHSVTRDDGYKLFIRVWRPESPARAVVQIVHGMAEHSRRYEAFASVLCEAGYEVHAHDARGHGESLSLNRDDGETHGQPGFLAPINGFDICVSDVCALGRALREEHPTRPLILFGHSWGSFVSQGAVEQETQLWSALVLSGTRGPARLLMGFARALASLVMAVTKPERFSPLVWGLADGSYNRSFKPARTPFDWLSRDEALVDAYVADPLCGFPCPVIFYRDLFTGLSRIHRTETMGAIRRDLPVLLIAGTKDPVGDFAQSPKRLVARYAAMGMSDVSLNLYLDARHELLNETVRTQVYRDILVWLDERCTHSSGGD